MARLFHGWKMVAAGGGIQFLQASLLLQSFGAYVAVLQEERGWSKTELSFAAALHQMEAAILGPVLGWFIDRFGPQGVIRTGVVVLAAGFMLMSQIESLGAFYAAFVVVALGSSMCGFMPLNISMIYWFERKRARALSMVSFGLLLPRASKSTAAPRAALGPVFLSLMVKNVAKPSAESSSRPVSGRFSWWITA